MGFTTGTYKVEGAKVTIEVDGSHTQLQTGAKQIRHADIKGATMALTSPTLKSPLSGKDTFFTATLQRVE